MYDFDATKKDSLSSTGVICSPMTRTALISFLSDLCPPLLAVNKASIQSHLTGGSKSQSQLEVHHVLDSFIQDASVRQLAGNQSLSAHLIYVSLYFLSDLCIFHCLSSYFTHSLMPHSHQSRNVSLPRNGTVLKNLSFQFEII